MTDNKYVKRKNVYAQYTENYFAESDRYSYKEFNSEPNDYSGISRNLFNMSLPKSKNWNTSEFRLLFVIEHIDYEDLKTHKLLFNQSGIVITNLLKHIKKHKKYIKNRNWAYSAINFNYAKTYHLETDQKSAFNKSFAKRVIEYIDKIQPTHVFILGDSSAEFIINNGKKSGYYRGWVHNFKTATGYECLLTHTIDYSMCYNVNVDIEDNENNDKAVEHANLLGFVARNLLCLTCDKLLWSISHIKPNYVLIDTIKKFNKFYTYLFNADVISVDTETKNLSNLNNKLLITQWSFDDELSYILPIDHPQTPFDAEELKYIKLKLKEFFTIKIEYDKNNLRYLIGHNLSFDLRIFRTQLGIPLIHWPLFDTMAGFYCFSSTTLVQTNKGLLLLSDLINSIKLDDFPFFLSYNIKKCKLEYKKIIYCSKHNTTERMIKITFNNSYIKITESHTIFCVNRSEYIKAIDIKLDDILLTQNLLEIHVNSIEIVESEELVYDVTVEDNHNLFVIDVNSRDKNPVLVHNCLNENNKAFKSFAQSDSQKYGKLSQQCCHYGNDFYQSKEGFSKEDRTNIENADLNDKSFLEYCAFDSVGVFALHNIQLEESKTEYACGISYKDSYKHFVLTQMSNSIHVFSHMEEKGTNVDIDYLLKMAKPDSPLNMLIKEEINKFYQLEGVIKTNKLLVKDNKLPQYGMFGEVKNWIFNKSVVAHKLKLFFDVLKLESVAQGKPTEKYPEGQPSIGKEFQTAYKDTIPEVKLLERINKLEKLRNSYINSFYKLIVTHDDGKKDSRIRPGFGFFDVVTGRSNSYRPSLQQIPQRSSEAKLIKRMFVANTGNLLIKLDFSAHEIRCWSYASKDSDLGQLFIKGRTVRKEFFTTLDPYLPKRINMEGDLHKLNCVVFFGLDLATADTKEIDEKRNQVKSIVFGAIYMRSIPSIAKQIGQATVDTQKIYDKFFDKYKTAKKWSDLTLNKAREYGQVLSLIGRRRNLFGYLTGVPSLMASMDRKSVNSSVQGLAADIANSAARLFAIELEKVSLDLGIIKPDYILPITTIQCMVHDSSTLEVPYEYIMVVIQLLSYCYTTKVEQYFNKNFGIEFTCPLEIDIELGFDESNMKKWNFAIINDKQKNLLEDASKKLLNSDKVFAKSIRLGILENNKDNVEFMTKIKEDKKELNRLIVKKVIDDVYDGSLLSILQKALETQKREQNADLDVEQSIDLIYNRWEESEAKLYMDKNYPFFA